MTKEQKTVEKIRAEVMEAFRDEVSFILERFGIELDGATEITEKTPKEKLPLYINEGKINSTLAKAFLAGADSIISREVFDGIYKVIHKEMIENSLRLPDVLQYSMGKIKGFSIPLRILGLEEEADLADSWANLDQLDV